MSCEVGESAGVAASGEETVRRGKRMGRREAMEASSRASTVQLRERKLLLLFFEEKLRMLAIPTRQAGQLLFG
jgi:hypothetical protein